MQHCSHLSLTMCYYTVYYYFQFFLKYMKHLSVVMLMPAIPVSQLLIIISFDCDIILMLLLIF